MLDESRSEFDRLSQFVRHLLDTLVHHRQLQLQNQSISYRTLLILQYPSLPYLLGRVRLFNLLGQCLALVLQTSDHILQRKTSIMQIKSVIDHHLPYPPPPTVYGTTHIDILIKDGVCSSERSIQTIVSCVHLLKSRSIHNERTHKSS